MSELRVVRVRVRISNPSGGKAWTSAKRAVRYIARGQARLVGPNTIEFITADYRVLSAGRSMKAATEPARVPPPSRGPALLVVAHHTEQSLRTFDAYPYHWEGYRRAA
jgi:hypothetical protein